MKKKGRGAVTNATGRFERYQYVDIPEEEPKGSVPTTVTPDTTKSTGSRLRDQDLLEAAGGGAAPRRAPKALVPMSGSGARREYRSLPARGAGPPHHAVDSGGSRRARAPGQRGDEIAPGAARRRHPRTHGGEEPGERVRLDHHARRGTGANDGAARLDAGASARDAARPFRGRNSLRGPRQRAMSS
jgi:hypothetical protein